MLQFSDIFAPLSFSFSSYPRVIASYEIKMLFQDLPILDSTSYFIEISCQNVNNNVKEVPEILNHATEA